MKIKDSQKEKMQVCSSENEVEKEEREVNPQLETEMELEEKNWAQKPNQETVGDEEDESPDEISEQRDHTQDF